MNLADRCALDGTEPSVENLEPRGEQLQQLRKDLTSITRGHVSIPPQVDQAVFQKAMKALARTERTRTTVGKPAAWIADLYRKTHRRGANS